MNVTRWGILGAAKIAKDHVIPASISLEKDTLISSQKIKDNINEILNV